jgi:hypothetical protein
MTESPSSCTARLGLQCIAALTQSMPTRNRSQTGLPLPAHYQVYRWFYQLRCAAAHDFTITLKGCTNMRRLPCLDADLPQRCLRNFDSCQPQQFMCFGNDSAIRHRQLPLQMLDVHAAVQQPAQLASRVQCACRFAIASRLWRLSKGASQDHRPQKDLKCSAASWHAVLYHQRNAACCCLEDMRAQIRRKR